jgi:hypothetical protein
MNISEATLLEKALTEKGAFAQRANVGFFFGRVFLYIKKKVQDEHI